VELKPGYKLTDVGMIPDDWDVKSLSDIGETLIGLTYSPSNVKSDGLLVLRSSNVQQGKLCFHDNVFVDADVPEKIIVKKGDILICVRNGSRDLIGKCAQIDEAAEGMTFGAFMAVFRTPDYPFVLHQFQAGIIKRQIHEHLGATINQITNRSLNSFRIPLPREKREKSVIAAVLSDVESLLAKLDQIISKKRNLKQASMQQLLTSQARLPGFSGEWEVQSMRSLGRTYGGLTGKSKTDFTGGASPYIPFMNVMTGPTINKEWLEYVEVSPNESQNLTEKGDLFFNGSSETPEEVGFCSVLLDEIPGLYLNSFCFGFRFHSAVSVNGLFFAYWFRGNKGRKVMSVLAQGATRYNIAKSAFLKLSLAIPTVEEQTAIATVLSDMDAEISLLEARREKTQAIKQGMMQELLTGRIRLV
jgi:type I restriction enzyme S subunit